MDPLSIIGSVAGVATAGVSLVAVIFETLDTYRKAPREISAIARGVQDTSLVLDQLTQVLSDGREIHTTLLRKSVLSVVQQIEGVHSEVWDLIERGESGFGRVKWAFRKRRMRDLTARIEAHKSTVQLVCTTLLLALQQRRVSRSQEPTVALSARRRLRRQAENLVNMAHRSLLDLTERDSSRNGSRDGSQDRDIDITHGDGSQPDTTRIPAKPSPSNGNPSGGGKLDDSDLNKEKSPEQALTSQRDADSTAMFLYDMVFSRTGDRNKDETTPTMSETSCALVVRDARGTDVVLARRPFPVQVIEDLLHDWTDLSDREIDEVTERDLKDDTEKLRHGQRRTTPTTTASTTSESESYYRGRTRLQPKGTRRNKRVAPPRRFDGAAAKAAEENMIEKGLLFLPNTESDPDSDSEADNSHFANTSSAQSDRHSKDNRNSDKLNSRSRAARTYTPQAIPVGGGAAAHASDGEKPSSVGPSGSSYSPRRVTQSQRLHESRADKIQKAAMASLLAGASEAFRATRSPKGGRETRRSRSRS